MKITARNIIVPHGFEVNYTLGFAKGLQANCVDFCVLSCDLTEPGLTASGIPNLNLRGSLDEKDRRRPNWPIWALLHSARSFFSCGAARASSILRVSFTTS